METIILILLLFIMGIFFGSFYTLAVYRIPKRQDIAHKHSYCPDCGHELGTFDLIPIFSYIFLRGRCRYCKQKIRPRYLILEILSGLLFVILGYVMKLNLLTLSIQKIVEFTFMVLYFTYIILISGIDKENRKMDKLVLVYGIVISIMYMLYLCIVEKANIYRYGMCLTLYIIVLIFDTITLKKYAKNSYVTGILLMIIIMLTFTYELITINSIILTLLTVAIYILIYKIKGKGKRKKKDEREIAKNISIGFCLGVTNIATLLLVLYSNNYLLK